MPLLDHCQPPRFGERHRGSFHASWATEIRAKPDRGVLPPRSFAGAGVRWLYRLP